MGLLFPRWWQARKDTYLFLPINGAGLGHLTRSLAIARRIRQQQPDAKIIFLTTSIGVMLVHRAGFVCHHVSPKVLLGEGDVRWNLLFYKTLKLVLSIHRPSVLVFDGTMPYLGLRRIMRGFGRTRFVWVKRGLYKADVDRHRLSQYVEMFDLVISPGELVECDHSDSSVGKVREVPPITLLDSHELYDRDYSRDILRVSRDRICAYVQLGAGNINGVSGVRQTIIECLKQRNILVVLGQSPISLSSDPDVLSDAVVVDYPNSKYFPAFDFAVLAGGYNSVCESVVLGLPTLFVPNVATGADDQLQRVKMSTRFGPFRVLDTTDERTVGEAIDAFLGSSLVSSYSGRNGAVDAARSILAL